MNFRDAALEVIRKEGGDKVHQVKGDKGGLTKFGISQKSYPHLDIANLTLSDALAIYKRDYWDKIGGDQIKRYTIAFAVFDMAVNRGPRTALKLAQESVGVNSDGMIGPATLNALNAISESRFLNSFIENAKKAYKEIVNGDSSQQKFYDGWINRANAIASYSSKYVGSINQAVTISVGAVLVFGVVFFLIFTKGKKA